MILPYFTPPSISLGVGNLKLEPFGLFAAAGIYLAAHLTTRAAKKRGLDVLPFLDYAPWGVGGGIVMGHFVHLFLYHPEEMQGEGGFLRIFKVWDGLSSFGGLLGGILAAVIFFKVKGIPFARYADSIALGLAPGWGVARLGCFAVHDHPGDRSDFFLAVNFPGGPRHDLGLYDALALFLFAAILYGVNRSGALKYKLLPLLSLLYGIQRFGTDFLRATDVAYKDARYAGLTPAQYGCIGLVLYGLVYLAKKPSPEAAVPPAATKPAATAK